MHTYAQTLRPSGPALGLALGGTAVVLVAATALDLHPLGAVAVINLLLILLWTHRFVLRWEILVSILVLTILLVPLGRYELPGSLPFHLEPYRLLVAVIAALWIAALLSDRELRWKPIGMLVPLAAFGLAILASDAFNAARIDELEVGPEVVKAISMIVSYWIVLLLVTSVITRREQLEVVLKALVGGGAAVGLFALIQYRTGFNVFDHLHVVPLLDFQEGGVPAGLEERAGDARVYASAQHPIALSAALVMLLPIGIYLGRRYRNRLWWAATAVIGVASISTVARTGSTMLLTVLVVLIALKPREMLRLWKWAIPFVIVIHLLAPGAIGSLKSAFLPESGLIAEQQTATSATGSNRLADAGPALREWWQRPYVGYGYGTRVTTVGDPKVNAFILDNQWLGLLLEVGLLGALAFLWLLVRSVRRLGTAARGDPTEHGWLLSGLAAAITAFGVGMITFDALAFTQVTFLLFIMIGLAIPALRFAHGTANAV
jgi:polysaccharide biosynthesis protein PslJ